MEVVAGVALPALAAGAVIVVAYDVPAAREVLTSAVRGDGHGALPVVVGFSVVFALASARYVGRRLPAWVAVLPALALSLGTMIVAAHAAATAPDAADLPHERRLDALVAEYAVRHGGRAVGLFACAMLGAFAAILLGRRARSVGPLAPGALRPVVALVGVLAALAGAAALGLHFGGGTDGPAAWIALVPSTLASLGVLLAARADVRAAPLVQLAVGSALVAGLVGAAAVAELPPNPEWLAGRSSGVSETVLLKLWEETSRRRAFCAALFVVPVVVAAFMGMRASLLAAAAAAPRAPFVLAVVAIAPPLLLTQDRVEARTHARVFAQVARELGALPGRPVADCDLPAGTLLVELAPALPDFELERPATIHAGGDLQARWIKGTAARFDRLSGDAALRVSGPYVADAVALSLPSAACGARVLLPVLPRHAHGPLPVMAGDRVLHLDVRDPARPTLRWMVEDLVHSEVSLADVRGRPQLDALFRDQWRMLGGHLDPADRRFDQAVVTVAPDAELASVLPFVEALQSVRRTTTSAGVTRDVASFQITLQTPDTRPRRPPDAGARRALEAARAATAKGDPAGAGRSAEAGLLVCAGGVCPLDLHAALFALLGGSRAASGAASEAADAYQQALLLDPAFALDADAPAAAALALTSARARPRPALAVEVVAHGWARPEDARAAIERISPGLLLCVLAHEPREARVSLSVDREGTVRRDPDVGGLVPGGPAGCLAAVVGAGEVPPPDRGGVGRLRLRVTLGGAPPAPGSSPTPPSGLPPAVPQPPVPVPPPAPPRPPPGGPQEVPSGI